MKKVIKYDNQSELNLVWIVIMVVCFFFIIAALMVIGLL